VCNLSLSLLNIEASRAEILHFDYSYRCPSEASRFAATALQTTLHKNIKTTISQLLDKNPKIWLVSFLASIRGV